jgi:hypothetical protein
MGMPPCLFLKMVYRFPPWFHTNRDNGGEENERITRSADYRIRKRDRSFT